MFELGYVIGTLIGDGSLIKWKTHYKIQLQVKNKLFVEKFAFCLNKITGKKVHRYSTNMKSQFSSLYKMEIAVTFSKQFYYFFKNIIETNNFNKFSKIEKKGIIKGFFDSEGSYINTSSVNRIQFSNSSILRLEQIKLLLSDLNIKCSGIYKSKEGVFKLVIYKQSEVKKFKDNIGVIKGVTTNNN